MLHVANSEVEVAIINTPSYDNVTKFSRRWGGVMVARVKKFLDSLTKKYSYSTALRYFNKYQLALRLYVDYDDNLDALIDSENRLVILRGVRGSGKTMAFLVATDKINRSGQGKRIALFFDCKLIAEALERYEVNGDDIDDPDVLDTIIEVEIGQQFTDSIERLLKHADKASFNERFLRRLNNGDFLEPLKRKTSQARKMFNKVLSDHVRFEEDDPTSSKERIMGSGISSDNRVVPLFDPEKMKSVRSVIQTTFSDWYEAISETRVEHVFLFFDEYSEPGKKYREKIAKMIQKIVTGTEKSLAELVEDETYCVRFAAYPAEQTLNNMFLGIGFGRKDKRYAEPYLKRLYKKRGVSTLGDLNLEGGTFLGKILKKTARYHDVGSIRKIIDIPRGKSKETFARLYSLGGGSIRRLMQMVYRALENPSKSLPFSVEDIRSEGPAYWADYLESILQPDTDISNEFEEAGLLSHDELQRISDSYNMILENVSKYLAGQASLLIRGRFLSIFEEDRKYILPLAERGVLFPINSYKSDEDEKYLQIFALSASFYDELNEEVTLDGITEDERAAFALRTRRYISRNFSADYFDEEHYA